MKIPEIFPPEVAMLSVPCAIVRGGTTKGVFVLDQDLPSDPEARDRALLALMGSAHVRQIDGLGGADPLTSKVAIVAPSRRTCVDVEYESVEVGIGEARVTHGLMCGNLLAGVGCFAMAEGLVRPVPPVTSIRIYCRSTRKTVVAQVPVSAVPGASLPSAFGPSPEVDLAFYNPGGATTGSLLPLAEPRSEFTTPLGETFAVSVVDAGTLYGFVRADALGLAGDEIPDRIDADLHARAAIEDLRRQIAARVNERIFPHGSGIGPRLVKMAVLAPPDPAHPEADVCARIVNVARTHAAYAVSGGICLAAAAAIDGTLVRDIVGPRPSPATLNIAHPSGYLSLRLAWSSAADGVFVHAAEIRRSARLLLRGVAYVFPDACPVPPAAPASVAALSS